MEMISNYVGGISPFQFGKTPNDVTVGFDLNGMSFAELLEKQLQKQFELDGNSHLLNNIPEVHGLNIGEFDGIMPNYGTNNDNSFEKISPVKETENSNLQNFNGKDKLSTSEVLAFFPSLFDTNSLKSLGDKVGLYNFEKRLAADSYGKYAKNIATNLSEFVADTLGI